MKVCLEIVSNGQLETKVLRPGSFLRIGRNEKSDWIVQDDKMSGAHCEINLRFDRLLIKDLKSKNGTYINGIRIEHSDLFVGDQFRIGDTLITIHEHLLDDEAVKVLTFPGGHKKRISQKISLDFTSARLKNQALFNGMALKSLSSHQKQEVNLRKFARSQIQLSKEEIRLKHRLEAYASNAIDYLLLITLIYAPLVIVKRVPTDHKGIAFLGMELVFILLFILINYKLGKFTLGEQLGGIKERCQAQ